MLSSQHKHSRRDRLENGEVGHRNGCGLNLPFVEGCDSLARLTA
jgi:hypothetical protein